jgi:hypothetical protein
VSNYSVFNFKWLKTLKKLHIVPRRPEHHLQASNASSKLANWLQSPAIAATTRRLRPGQFVRAHQHIVDAIPFNLCLFLNETRVRMDITLPYGRARRDERVVDERPVLPGETVNIVAVLTEDGLDTQWYDQGPLTAERLVACRDVF